MRSNAADFVVARSWVSESCAKIDVAGCGDDSVVMAKSCAFLDACRRCRSTFWLCGLSLLVAGCTPHGSSANSVGIDAAIPATSTREAIQRGHVYDAQGQRVMIDDLSHQKNLLVLVTRGVKLAGDLENEDCQACLFQTNELARNWQEFEALNCEVVVVVPTMTDGPQTLKLFLTATRKTNGEAVPLRMFYDHEFQWAKQLGITKSSAYAQRSLFLLGQTRDPHFVSIARSLGEQVQAVDMLRELKTMEKESSSGL